MTTVRLLSRPCLTLRPFARDLDSVRYWVRMALPLSSKSVERWGYRDAVFGVYLPAVDPYAQLRLKGHVCFVH
jgi:hypothetical protein